MSYQLEVIKFRDMINVTDLPRFVPRQAEPTLEVRGEDFSSVEKVLINDKETTKYIIVNTNTIWVAMTEAEAKKIQSIEVLSSNFTRTSIGSKVTFEIGTRTRKIKGILKLLQLYVKWLLQNPGSDIFNPDRGGGVQEIVGRLMDMDKMDVVLSALTQSITRTNNQIKAAQAKSTGLPSDERLLDATLLGITRSPNLLEARARVRLTTVAGDEAVSALIL